MYPSTKTIIEKRLQDIKQQGLWKSERLMTTPQDTHIQMADQKDIINVCANNYLGLSNHPDIIDIAKKNIDRYGYGLSSVRFICGTQDVHKQLEQKLSTFLKMDDTILYSSCFDANGGLFETLLGPDDAVISDELNHASIIDGVRLCKATRYRYKNNDMQDLEKQLKDSQNARIRLIITDGVFSMDGIIANLQGICDLAERYNALVAVDDSHAVGFIGQTGAGTPELCGVQDKVDIITGTLGKALGGASGGYISARQEIVDLLRQVSRPYLFSNTLAPVITATTLEVLEIVAKSQHLRQQLDQNRHYFAKRMREENFDIPQDQHPIIPVMLYDAQTATAMADELLKRGVYAIGFTYPVVPKGKARIRIQLSAKHTQAELDQVIQAFVDSRTALAKQ